MSEPASSRIESILFKNVQVLRPKEKVNKVFESCLQCLIISLSECPESKSSVRKYGTPSYLIFILFVI